MKTYADGLREAARQCELEILPERPDNVVDLKKPSKEFAAVGAIVKSSLEAAMTTMAHRLRRLADAADCASGGGQ